MGSFTWEEYEQLREFVRVELLEPLNSNLFNNKGDGQLQQRILANQWRALGKKEAKGLSFSDVGFSQFSLNDEDGILLYLFTRVGHGSRRCVQIGSNCKDSHVGLVQNNTANLIVNHGWHGLLLDRSEDIIGQSVHFYARCLKTRHFHIPKNAVEGGACGFFSPVCSQEMVTPSNINRILDKNGMSGDIDLLSIDVDGQDYHIWDAITASAPRVVDIVFNGRIDPASKWYMRRDDEFIMDYSDEDLVLRSGCSLGALVALGLEKNYSLVGINSIGRNALFVRNDQLSSASGIQAVTIEESLGGAQLLARGSNWVTSHGDVG